MNSRKRAFTLIELLVVVAIIALLIAILLPSLARARDRAKTTACAANERAFYQAMSVYATEFDGTALPFKVSYTGGQKNSYWFSSSLLGAEMGKVDTSSTLYGTYYKDMMKKYLHCPSDITPGQAYADASATITFTYTDYAYNSNMGAMSTNTWNKWATIPVDTLILIETHQGINQKSTRDYYYGQMSDLFIYNGDQNNGQGNSSIAGRIHNGAKCANMLFADGRIILDDAGKMNVQAGVVQPWPTAPNSGVAGTDYQYLIQFRNVGTTPTYPFPFK